MSRDIQLKNDWDKLVQTLSAKFGEGSDLKLDAIIYLIGVHELGKGNLIFDRDDKINLMHIAICRLLEPYGFYKFDYYDQDGWPHFITLEQLPGLKSGEQTILMKEAIVLYFRERGDI